MFKKYFIALFVVAIFFWFLGLLLKSNSIVINQVTGVFSNQKRLSQEISELDEWNKFSTESKVHCDRYTARAVGRFYCHSNKPGDVDIFVVGDSHAEHLFLGLNYYLGERHVLHAIGVGGCPPFANFPIIARRPEGGINCKREYEHVIDEVIDSSAQVVILSSLNAYYLSGLSFGEFVRNVKPTEPWKKIGSNAFSQYKKNVEMGIDGLLSRLIANGKSVIFVYDIPHMLVNPFRCAGSSFEYSALSSCTYNVKYHIDYESVFKEMIGGVLDKYPSVTVVDPLPIFCRNEVCSPALDGEILYRDKDHLSFLGSLILGGYIGGEVLSY